MKTGDRNSINYYVSLLSYRTMYVSKTSQDDIRISVMYDDMDTEHLKIERLDLIS
jgi:hypothetical protein